ncbi:unnamed protein product [Soboliphyme baturini]|uniref:Chitin-binding type-2 domain-containing protein n=1 Tax=Soboliphyme baturini TaxID=241478 RepID=A0A183IQ63_9BILA|nr:unnamed protein product [Soboliphyme baturini]
MVYDPHTDSCQPPSNTEGCTGTRPTQTTPTVTRSSAPTSPPAFDCSNMPDGLYPNPDAPNSCDIFYYSCGNGNTEKLYCPRGLYFDPALSECNAYAYIPNCSGQQRPTTVRQTTIATTPTQTLPIDCTTLENGNYPDPSGSPPDCSNRFFSCSNGKVIVRECPTALFYDSRHNTCDSFMNVFACSGIEVTTPVIPQTPSTLPPVDFDCTNREDGFYVNPINQCSRTYYSCTGSLARELNCQFGLIFDPETESCQPPESTFICTGTSPTTTVPTTTVIPPTTEVYPIDCSNLANGVYPNPTKNCDRIFFSCTNTIARRFRCPGELYFNPEDGRCETYEDIPACTGIPRPPTTTTLPTVAPTTEALPVDCTTMPNGRYSDPANRCSNVFYVCSEGVTRRQFCPGELYFDVATSECLTFDYVEACTGSPPPTMTITLSQVFTTGVPEFSCIERPNGIYADPRYKCVHYYFICANGRTFKQYCPGNLFFDSELKRCRSFVDIYACSGRTSVMTTAATTPISDVPSTETPIPVDCTNLENGNYPDPEKACSCVFYTCIDGRGVQRQCPRRTYFDPDLRVCNIYRKIAACTGHVRTTTVTVTVTPQTTQQSPTETVPSFDCTDQQNGPHGNPLECNDYYFVCYDGTSIFVKCTAGTFFNPEEGECELPHKIMACRNKPPGYYRVIL